MLYALRLENTHDGWDIVRSVLADVLLTDSDPVGKQIYEYFVKETMPFKSFLRMRMEASLKTVRFFCMNHLVMALREASHSKLLI